MTDYAFRDEPTLSGEALLRWYLDAGVDECIAEEPQDFYTRAAEAKAALAAKLPPSQKVDPAQKVKPPPSGSGQPAAAPAQPPPGQTEALTQAVHVAKAAMTVDELKKALEAFDGCGLKRTATNLVFTDGNPEASVLFIGEGPGAEEDRQGLPFVGPSGRLLDQMLESIGLDRSRVLISNTVFWRPPGNRTPTTGEVALCQPFVERLIELVDPNLIVALGKPAANALTGRAEALSKMRGRWFDYQCEGLTRPVPLTALYHPAYLLRTPAQKRMAWKDLLMIRRKLLESG
ncbi:MAG: uracil-DNA glycosylase [Magnetovibrionaceae bacterium]